MPDCARRVEDGSFHKSMKIGKNAKPQNGGKKKTLLKDNRVPIHNTKGKFSPPLDGLLHRQRTAAILLDSNDSRISKPFDMDKTTLLPLRGPLGRKPGRATQAKVRTRKRTKRTKKNKNAKNEKKKKRKMKKIKRKDEKEKRRKKMKRIEKKRRTKLARLKTQKGQPWQKLERKRRG
ncbi:hypothetical protein HYC85_029382 [Camellia sinensis]|uniref:Uncharacterized protein n=1 Tax=Camellia sinensis TaxID=4442 RepID=A0A7J7FZ48_CAMSI|nr:hypothetical protein HYC85_029382 [Camellia sinensis]